ncbi:hypothetical protein ACIBKX_32675 [Streptomyces sp. NPDC050658]|uniref:hypothetical protein n=1 Tax=unclassified Streptomyces TaxID=2593676 RepID=UPI0034142A1E
MKILDDTKPPIPLTDFSTNPDPIQAGESVTLRFSFHNDTDSSITCYGINIDLNPGDTAENLCTVQDLKSATVTPKTGAGWDFNVGADTTGKPIIQLLPHKGGILKAHGKLDVDVLVTVNDKLNSDDLTQTVITVTEFPNADINDPGVQLPPIPLAKTQPGTEFDSFAPDPREEIIVKQGELLALSWVCNPVGISQTQVDGQPYYTLTINYDQLDGALDITALNNNGTGRYTGHGPNNDLTANNLTLAHTTLFTLTLTLFDKNHQPSSTHTQTALVTVQNSDVDLHNLTVDYTTSILKSPHLVTTTGIHTSTTDGLLLATAQGADSAVVVQITPPNGGTARTYKIKSSTAHHAEPPSAFTGNRILLPVPQNSTVNIAWTDKNGTYRTAWYPLGAGTLAKKTS